MKYAGFLALLSLPFLFILVFNMSGDNVTRTATSRLSGKIRDKNRNHVTLIAAKLYTASVVLPEVDEVNNAAREPVFTNAYGELPVVQSGQVGASIVNDTEVDPLPDKTTRGFISVTEDDWRERVKTCYRYKEAIVQPLLHADMLAARQCKQRLPEALVVGVKKCGTGTLSRYLNLHPNISISRERCFPGEVVNSTSLAEWIHSMPYSTPQQLPMTECPGTIRSKVFPTFKPVLSPRVKFIVILRDPVDRSVSDYLHNVAHSKAANYHQQPFTVLFKRNVLHETFVKTVWNSTGNTINRMQLIDIGKYIISINKSFDVYSRDQFLFVDGDAFAKDPFPVMREVEAFLGLPRFYQRKHFVYNREKGFYCADVPGRPDTRCMIDSKGRKHPVISVDILKSLHDMYRPYNLALANQLGLNFSWIFK